MSKQHEAEIAELYHMIEVLEATDGAWLMERTRDDEQVKAYLNWRSQYNPVFLELKIALANGKRDGKPNFEGALKQLAVRAKQHGLTLSWKLRKRK